MDTVAEHISPEVLAQQRHISFRGILSRELLLHLAFIFIVNLLATYFHWYSAMWWFDMPMHFWGGYAVGILGLLFFMHSFRRHPGQQRTYARTALGGMVFVLVIGAGWEGFEYIVQYGTGSVLANPMDSLADIFFDIAGGALCLWSYLPRTSSLYKKKAE